MPDVLKNKSYKTYNYLSRYESFPYYYHEVDKKYVYGTHAQLKRSTIFTSHKIEPGDTLDTLALKYYNNPTLFWVIADFNSIQDPFMKLVEGNYINIPSIAGITFNK
jgi:hypothetical protein